MDIAIVHPSLAVKGGAENVVVWLASGLSERGHRVRVITSKLDRQLFGGVDLSFETVELGGHGYRPSWSGMRQAAARLRPLLEGADFVNAHNFPANFWTYWALQSVPTPAAWFCQEPLRFLYRPPLDPHVSRLLEERWTTQEASVTGRIIHRFRHARSEGLGSAWRRLTEDLRNRRVFGRVRAMDRLVARSFSLVMTNSEFVAGQVRQLFGINPRVCHLGIPMPTETNLRSNRGDGRAPVQLLTVARLTVEKNVETILKALKVLPAQTRAQVRLTIIGSGPERAYLVGMSERLGLTEQVDFRGFVTDDELSRCYSACDVVVYLSLDETFGLVFAEAGARGKPSIGPDHGGPTEFIEDGRTGLTVDALDPSGVANAIHRLVQDADLRRVMGQAAREKVERHYTVDAMVSRYLGLVRDWLDHPNEEAV